MILRQTCMLLVALFLLCVHLADAIQLRKHTQVVSADNRKSEPSIVLAMQGQEQPSEADMDKQKSLESFTRGDACGHGTLSCMAFAHEQYKGMPVLCGVLQNAPVCQSAATLSSNNNNNACDAFCDSDGGARVCAFAFSSCCSRSPNGCISSDPRNVVVYDK